MACQRGLAYFLRSARFVGPGGVLLASAGSCGRGEEEQAALTPTPAPSPSVPAEAGAIAFASQRDGNYDVYGMGPDGSGQTRLTDDPATDGWPAWSAAHH